LCGSSSRASSRIRYKRSLLGVWWPLLSPLLEMAALAGATTAVLMPDMREDNVGTRGAACDEVAGRGSRAVVCDDDLEIAIGLACERTQNGCKRVFAVVGRDDDGNQFAHYCPRAGGWPNRLPSSIACQVAQWRLHLIRATKSLRVPAH